MDDVLAEEVEPLVRSGSEPRANEDRLHEPPADDEPSPDVRISGEDVPMPGLLDLDEIEARSRLAASLRPSAFPATRSELIAVATEEHATDDVLAALHSLPPRRRFVHVQQVWEALGGERERRGAAVPRAEEPPAEEVAAASTTEARPEPEPMATAEEAIESKPVGGASLCEQLVHAGVAVMMLPLRITAGVVRGVYHRVVQQQHET
jgi:hypothetical protein